MTAEGLRLNVVGFLQTRPRMGNYRNYHVKAQQEGGIFLRVHVGEGESRQFLLVPYKWYNLFGGTLAASTKSVSSQALDPESHFKECIL